MKKSVKFLIVISAIFSFTVNGLANNPDIIQTEQQRNEQSSVDDDEIYVAVEEQARFKGGTTELMRWLSDKTTFPESCEYDESCARVVVRMVIEKDGSIGDVTVVKSVDDVLSEAAIKTVKKMPQWHPGKINGKPVRSYFNLPIIYRKK